ncbi:hypothetical protein [Terrihabitans rhizophilus]|nr:hypothetical protein [Terrihabitans sp. PJ23]
MTRASTSGRAVAAALIITASGMIWYGARIVVFSVHPPRTAEEALAVHWPLRGVALERQAGIEEASWRAGRDDGAVLEQVLKELLAVRPGYGAGWAALANLRLARGAAIEDVIRCLDLSAWTAPRENGVMLARVDLGLRIWERLDGPRQLSIVADLVGIGAILQEPQMARLRPLLLTRTDEERAALSALVRTRSGGELPGWAQWLGL